MTVWEVIEEFWFDWKDQELTHEERRAMLIEEGADPDALTRRVKLMVLETKANMDMERKLKQLE